MKRCILPILLIWLSFAANGQSSSGHTLLYGTQNPVLFPDTLKSFLVKKNPPFLFESNMMHEDRPLFNKILRANNCVIGYNLIIGGTILLVPKEISQWDVNEFFTIPAMKQQYKKTFTTPPVFDHDIFMVNYLGHPYQGSYYYNSMRSQGATLLESSLFCLGQTLLWEYVWEGGMEQPSIQDLITTPIGGILLGELFHLATIRMSRNGFEWYEIAATCIINPSYAFNNRFRFNKRTRP